MLTRLPGASKHLLLPCNSNLLLAQKHFLPLRHRSTEPITTGPDVLALQHSNHPSCVCAGPQAYPHAPIMIVGCTAQRAGCGRACMAERLLSSAP